MTRYKSLGWLSADNQMLVEKWMSYRGDELNHWEFFNTSSIIRFGIIALAGIRFYANGYLRGASETVEMIDRALVVISMGVYVVFVLASHRFVKKHPLVLLGKRFPIACAIVDILVISVWVLSAGWVNTKLLLLFLLPFYFLVRFGVDSKWVMCLTLLVPSGILLIIYWVFPIVPLLQDIAQPEWNLLSSLDWFLFVSLMGVIVHSAGRIWWRQGPKILRSDIRYALKWMQEQSGASVIVLRLHHQFEDESYLFLVGSTWANSTSEASILPTFIRIKEDDDYPMKRLMERDDYLEINSQEGLLNALTNLALVERLNLNSAVMQSFGARCKTPPQGTFACFWSEPVHITSEDQRLLKHWKKRLATYIRSYPEEFRALTTAEKQTIEQISKDRKLDNGIHKIINTVDFNTTADIICETATQISDCTSAFVLIYDYQKELCRNEGLYGVKNISAEQVRRLHLSKARMSNLPEQFDALAEVSLSPLQEIFKYCLGYQMFVGNHQKGDTQRIIGVLFVGDYRDDFLLDSINRQRLSSLAKHGAVDLRNNQLYAWREQSHFVLNALHKATKRINEEQTAGDEKELFQAIVNTIQNSLNSAFCTMMRTNGVDQFLTETFVASDIKRESSIGTPYSHDVNGLIPRVKDQENEIVFLNYVDDDPVNHFVVKHQIKMAFAIGIHLNDDSTTLLFINYRNQDAQYELMELFLPILREQITKAYEFWLLLQQNRQENNRRQRELWRHDIHDQLNELQYKVELPLERLLQKMNGEASLFRLDQIHRDARSISSTLKQVMEDMNHPVLAEYGLIRALKHLSEQPGSVFNLRIEGSSEPQPQVINSLYRIAREAINNARKHGEPPIDMFLNISETEAYMRIMDRGNGFLDDESENGSGKGLMQYQADLIQAELNFKNDPIHGGAIVSCYWSP